MADRKQRHRYLGPLSREIEEFVEFKRQLGYAYTNPEYALIAFDRFCVETENQGLAPLQLAEKWVKQIGDKPKHDRGHSVRQLGQYLTERGHPKAFTILTTSGNAPMAIGIKPSIFAAEINDFVSQKRLEGRKYDDGEFVISAFDKFCAMQENEFLIPQQLADAWIYKSKGKGRTYIATVREFGIYLTTQGSEKAFTVQYANRNTPKPVFRGYTSMFAEAIESFLKDKRAKGLKYRDNEFILKGFDRFCNEHPGMSPQQLAEAFIRYQADRSRDKQKGSTYVINSLGSYLAENGYPNTFEIADEKHIAGPYSEEISTFVDFKKSCGYKYRASGYQLRCFDVFCTLKENEHLKPQQLADRWVLKKDGEHPNTRAGRVGPVRVFGKYLSIIGHPMAFSIADDAARGADPKPPYLFAEGDIDIFFRACTELEPDETGASMHIVLPAAFLFMHCMGVRTCELKILMEDVSFETGEIVIMDAKTGNRVVYMSEELSNCLLKYILAVEKVFPRRKYLFPASTNRSRNDFAKRFSEIWTRSVPDDGRGKPRLYDLRHHLLYRNVELCMRNGGDVNVLRPYMMRHMGHRLPESFQYYFHLSPPIRKELSRIKSDLDWMIPDVMEVPYE